MPINYNELAIQRVFNINVFDLDDGSLLAKLTHLKNTSWSNNAQIVYAQGGTGNPKLIGFGHSKESNLTATSATISDGSWGIQTGSGVTNLTNTKNIQYSDTLTCATADEVVTAFTATGTAGNEILWAYKINANGGIIKKYKQAATATTDTDFAYSSADKKLTFQTGEIAIGDRVQVFYYPNVKEARLITNATDKFSMNVKAIAESEFLDVCTGKSYIGQLIYYKAKVGEETTFDLAADGDAAVQSLSFEALQSCESPKLWDIFIFDSEDIGDAE